MSGNTLFTPLQVGTTTMKNRIGMSALTRNRAQDTYPTEVMKEYYVQRALGGAGLIVSEGILINRQGTAWDNAPGLWDEKHVAGWKKITDAVHAAGGKMYAQLWHAGRLSHPDTPQHKLSGIPIYAPSAIAARGGKFRQIPGEPGYVTPKAIGDPWIIAGYFKRAAIFAKMAGFDGVELHGASGNLITQFLDYNSNQRTDNWGGSVENRSRFGLVVLRSMVKVFGPNVGLKISPAGGYNDIGMPLQDTLNTYSYFISEADKLNLAYITLVRYSPKFDFPIDGKRRGTDHNVVEAYRPFIRNAKLFVNTDVTPEEGEQLVSSGKVDGIFIGFSWITHPDLVKRIEHGKPLNNIPNIPYLQINKSEDDWSTGYTDYPLAVY
ncbi:hypothetical protein BDZ97DRAFT_1855277 [Flammula alnicola]|nr:hypothetical protein BDZ97DRAFT_1855277 [Flammula alnicola]